MFEKVNPAHPDKLADRIAGAIVDLAYMKSPDPKIACEVLLGHGECFIIMETDQEFSDAELDGITMRIAGVKTTGVNITKQDVHLANNQFGKIRCGDNGIFLPVKFTAEERFLTKIANRIYAICPHDGKYLIDGNKITICQSNLSRYIKDKIKDMFYLTDYEVVINPLGDWTGGPDVDAGATNRKLGSDMGSGISGGGLHGKDLSKADVTLNICATLFGNGISCSIGDEYIGKYDYAHYVDIARNMINKIGGFEKFAEWGLIRPDIKILFN